MKKPRQMKRRFLRMILMTSLIKISLAEGPVGFFGGIEPLPSVFIPSSEPSISTRSPSEAPSASPTSSPSKSQRPSYAPSWHPSISLSPTVSPQPSGIPTTYPSALPSDLPSNVPSSLPTASPTFLPSDSPTNNPTISPRPTITVKPSDKPSYSPSIRPSPSPSISPAPTFSPSFAPSDLPSSTPTTGMPSAQPIPLPTSTPSKPPSKRPSSAPSSTPSSSPTRTCHDKKDYRSPINSLKCDDHSGTDCHAWRNLGLNTTSLGNLINSCPESCNIPCGSFVQYSIPVSYRLSKIAGLLDVSAKKSLEDVSYDYIVKWMKSAEPDSIFELDQAVLSSQSLVSVGRRRLRTLTAPGYGDEVLVTVIFDGFSIGLSFGSIEMLLVSGMNSTGFTAALQEYEFFETAVITSAASKDPDTVHEPDEDKRTGPSSATVLVAILGVIGLGAALGMAVGKREKLKAWYDGLHSSNNDIPTSPPQQGRPRFISFDMTPTNRQRVTYKTVFYRFLSSGFKLSSGLKNARRKRNLKSFDFAASDINTSNSKSKTGNINAEIDANNNYSASSNNNILQLMVGISESRSKSSTEAEEDSSGTGGDIGKTDQKKKTSENEKIADPRELISPMSEVSEETNQTEHPLSKIISPMIVIDNIDDTPSNSKERNGEPSIVPKKGFEPSSKLISALNAPPTSLPMLDLTQMSNWQTNEETLRALSPLGIVVDSDSEDDESESSVVSTPVNSATPKSGISSGTRSWSTNALDRLDNCDSKNYDSKKSPMHILALPSNLSEDSAGALGFSMDTEDEDRSIEILFGRSGTPTSQISPMNNTSGHERNSGSFLNSIRSMSPGGSNKGTPKSNTGGISLRRPSFTKMSVLKRKSPQNNSDRSERTSSETNPSKVELSALPMPGLPDSTRLEFKVPRTGQLGLVIEARSRSGPEVHAVKDYSPLFGKIVKGDKICEIDGKDQTGNTLSDVMHLLASKPGRLLSSANLKIVVERKILKLDRSGSQYAPSHKRDNSYGSYGSCSIASSNRIIEDVDSMIADIRSKELPDEAKL